MLGILFHPTRALPRASRLALAGAAAAAIIVAAAGATAGSGCVKATGGSSSQGAATAADDLASRVDALVLEVMDAEFVPAISVGIMRNDEVVLAKGYGFADVENQVPATEHTVFRIGSITKQFTAAAIMLLVEEGKLSLDAQLTDFLPDYPTGGRRISIEQLLNHTSGIKGYTEMPEFRKVTRDDLPPTELIAIFSAAPFEFEPGERYQYNNSAYFLLGVIIEKVSGERYADFVQQRFFAPLGMDDSHYLANAPIIRRRAEGYEVRNGELINDIYLSMRLPYAAGSLGSSVMDLLTWQRALIGNRAVSAASHAAMRRPTTLNDGSAYPYGYGLGLGIMEDHRKIGHGGGINGFRAHLSYYPDDDLTVVVLTNLGSAHPEVLESRIARQVLGIGETVVEYLPTAPAELSPYVGVYDPGRSPIRVALFDGELRMFGGPLRRVGEHRFLLGYDPYFVVTFDVEDGVAVSMTGGREGSQTVAPRVSQ